MVPQKKRGPRPTGKGIQIQVRLHEPILSELDEWAKQFAPDEELSKPEVIRRILREYLTSCGISGESE